MESDLKPRQHQHDADPEDEDNEDDNDDDDDDVDADYNEVDAAAEEAEAAEEDAAANGTEGGDDKRSRKRGRSDVGKPGSKATAKKGRMLLEAVDADEIAALREDAVEQFGRDVLADESDGKNVHTRAAERAELGQLTVHGAHLGTTG